MIYCNLNLIFFSLLAIIITQFDMYHAGKGQSKFCKDIGIKDVMSTIYGNGRSTYKKNEENVKESDRFSIDIGRSTENVEESDRFSIDLTPFAFGDDFILDCIKKLEELCGKGNTEASTCFEYILYNRTFQDLKNNDQIKFNYIEMFLTIEIDESKVGGPYTFCLSQSRKMACKNQMDDFFKYKTLTDYGYFKFTFICQKLENTTMTKDIPDTIPENNIPDLTQNNNVTKEELLKLETTVEYVPHYIKSMFQKIIIDFSKLPNNRKFCEDQFKDLKPKAPNQT